jgi:hypothetical protein
MGWVSEVESQPYEFIDFQWCPLLQRQTLCERLRSVNTFIDFFGFRGVLKKIILKSAQELFGIDRASVAIQGLDFDA